MVDSDISSYKCWDRFDASQTYNNVPLYYHQRGTGATATVATNSSGQVSSISLISNTAGSGYVIDVLGITTSNVIKGANAEITV